MCSRTEHPTPETLEAYALGKLDDSSAEVITTHLEDCPDCRRQVAGGLRGDGLRASR